MRIARALFGALVAALAIGDVSLDAEQSVVWSTADLAGFSSVVLTGRVAGTTTAWDPSINAIYTYAIVDVAEVWKGDVGEPRIAVKMLGGRVGDVELRMADQAQLTAGSDVLLWLEVRPRDGTLYPTALNQGVWRLGVDPASGAWSASPQAARATSPQPTVDLRSIVAASPMPAAGPITLWPTELGAAGGPAADRPLDFTLLPASEGGPGRWHESDESVAVPVDMQTPPSGLGGGTAEIQAALALWNNSGMALRLTLGNTRTARCLMTFDGDGRISISFNDPCSEISDSGAIVGLGGAYMTPGDKRTINGVVFNEILQGVVMLNNITPGNNTFLTSRGCFQDAIAHNLGHAIGLGHATTQTAIMWADPQSTCTSAPSRLGTDDTNGARFIYPVGITTGPPGTPSGLRATILGTTVTLNWQAASTGGAVTTWMIEAGSAAGLTNLANAAVAANAGPTATFTAVPAGYYFVRVRARNTFGTSSASNEIEVPVNCPAPLPPRSLSFTRVGNVVTFNWLPPAAPGATGYRFGVGSAPGLDNLLISDVPLITSASASGPPGTYYVRLRSKSNCGLSTTASNEVVVVIP